MLNIMDREKTLKDEICYNGSRTYQACLYLINKNKDITFGKLSVQKHEVKCKGSYSLININQSLVRV